MSYKIIEKETKLVIGVLKLSMEQVSKIKSRGFVLIPLNSAVL